ncbi:hypothetical protein BD413DRAFT_617970 [Trametes elegans]|nr:hypothetical protein BD413DRAFT_617970 [Trametes elegans]
MTSCDHFLPHGTYVLLNKKDGTALDLSGGNKTIEGHDFHGENNQQWKFTNTGHGWAIESMRRRNDGKPLYLSIRGKLNERVHVVPSVHPLSWYVWEVDGALRIGWPGTDYVVELGGWGDEKPGTHVQIMRLKPGEPCQLWYFSRCSIPVAPN